jgi:hypothetical protein
VNRDTLEAAQAILNRYRFQDDGRDLFPRNAQDLTPAQVRRVLYLGEQKARLETLKAEAARLETLKARLATT